MIGSRQQVRGVVAVALALLAGLLLLRRSARSPGDLSTMDRAVLKIVAPAQDALSSVARRIGDLAGRYVDLVHVRAENERLRSENSRLRADLLDARRAAGETDRYRRLLGLRDNLAAETLVARVIAIDASPYFRVARVQIDRGESMVARGMPVITPEGVVGRINRVHGSSADILLSVDPQSAIDVIIPRTGGRGILRGKAGENGYRCAIEYLVRGDEAKEGDLVVTSGLGGAFPRDLPVGRVTRATGGGRGLYQDIEVTPEVDFARLHEILVIVAPPPAADPEASARKAPPPARGLMVYR